MASTTCFILLSFCDDFWLNLRSFLYKVFCGLDGLFLLLFHLFFSRYFHSQLLCIFLLLFLLCNLSQFLSGFLFSICDFLISFSGFPLSILLFGQFARFFFIYFILASFLFFRSFDCKLFNLPLLFCLQLSSCSFLLFFFKFSLLLLRFACFFRLDAGSFSGLFLLYAGLFCLLSQSLFLGVFFCYKTGRFHLSRLNFSFFSLFFCLYAGLFRLLCNSLYFGFFFCLKTRNFFLFGFNAYLFSDSLFFSVFLG